MIGLSVNWSYWFLIRDYYSKIILEKSIDIDW